MPSRQPEVRYDKDPIITCCLLEQDESLSGYWTPLPYVHWRPCFAYSSEATPGLTDFRKWPCYSSAASVPAPELLQIPAKQPEKSARNACGPTGSALPSWLWAMGFRSSTQAESSAWMPFAGSWRGEETASNLAWKALPRRGYQALIGPLTCP